jgi:hypothetical protein
MNQPEPKPSQQSPPDDTAWDDSEWAADDAGPVAEESVAGAARAAISCKTGGVDTSSGSRRSGSSPVPRDAAGNPGYLVLA